MGGKAETIPFIRIHLQGIKPGIQISQWRQPQAAQNPRYKGMTAPDSSGKGPQR